jgi:hypothetical protein
MSPVGAAKSSYWRQKVSLIPFSTVNREASAVNLFCKTFKGMTLTKNWNQCDIHPGGHLLIPRIYSVMAKVMFHSCPEVGHGKRRLRMPSSGQFFRQEEGISSIISMAGFDPDHLRESE